MEREIFEKLKLELNEIKYKQIEFNREKIKKNKNSIDNSITNLKNKLVANFNLMEYDLHIKSDIHNTDFFIHDVEMIILKISEKNEI